MPQREASSLKWWERCYLEDLSGPWSLRRSCQQDVGCLIRGLNHNLQETPVAKTLKSWHEGKTIEEFIPQIGGKQADAWEMLGPVPLQHHERLQHQIRYPSCPVTYFLDFLWEHWHLYQARGTQEHQSLRGKRAHENTSGLKQIRTSSNGENKTRLYLVQRESRFTCSLWHHNSGLIARNPVTGPHEPRHELYVFESTTLLVCLLWICW